MEPYRLICVFLLAIVATSRATRLEEWLENHEAQSPGSSLDTHTDKSPKSKHSDHKHGKHGKKDATSNTRDCLSTQQKFVDLNIGEASLTINSKSHDPDMDICYNGKLEVHRKSCCTQTMARKYKVAAQSQVLQSLESKGSFLLGLLSDNTAHYQELFLSLLEGAHNKTERLFQEVYHLPLMDRWGPTESLFLDLGAYLKQREVSIHKSIETFFDELFPLVFHNNVNDPRSSELHDEYRECLMTVRKDVYPPPFGGIPSKLSHQLSRSFGSARIFLDALKLGVKVINFTSHIPLREDCQRALTRLEYCGHCDGQTDTAPCRGFCYNVMRGCLAHVTDVNIHWNEFIDTLELLTVNMRGSYDIEEVLHSLHSKVSEAIMHAMETGVKFSHKVKERCGHPKTRKSVSDTAGSAPPGGVPSRPTLNSALLPAPVEANSRLYAKIEMFMRSVIAAKGYFSHLPDTMCTETRYSADTGAPCWNGDSVATYNKSIMMKDLSAQSRNPEVHVDKQPHPNIKDITDQLQTMKKLLSTRVNLERMQGDSPAAAVAAPDAPQGDDPSISYQDRTSQDQWNGGGYSGDWKENGGYYNGQNHPYYNYNGPLDDEDFYGSGSGAGSGMWGSKTTGRIKTPTRKTGPGALPDQNTGDISFANTDSQKTAPPYITRNPSTNEFVDPSSAASVAASVVCVCVSVTAWFVMV